jgi:hypothetical protein
MRMSRARPLLPRPCWISRARGIAGIRSLSGRGADFVQHCLSGCELARGDAQITAPSARSAGNKLRLCHARRNRLQHRGPALRDSFELEEQTRFAGPWFAHRGNDLAMAGLGYLEPAVLGLPFVESRVGDPMSPAPLRRRGPASCSSKPDYLLLAEPAALRPFVSNSMTDSTSQLSVFRGAGHQPEALATPFTPCYLT